MASKKLHWYSLLHGLQVARVHAIHGPHEILLVLGIGHGAEGAADVAAKALHKGPSDLVLLVLGHLLFLRLWRLWVVRVPQKCWGTGLKGP